MANDFNSLFAEMLEAFEAGKSVEEIVAEQSLKEGLDEAQTKEVAETVKEVDRLTRAFESLQEAKANGDSREDWFADQWYELTKDLDEEEKATLLKALEEAQDKL